MCGVVNRYRLRRLGAPLVGVNKTWTVYSDFWNEGMGCRTWPKVRCVTGWEGEALEVLGLFEDSFGKLVLGNVYPLEESCFKMSSIWY